MPSNDSCFVLITLHFAVFPRSCGSTACAAVLIHKRNTQPTYPTQPNQTQQSQGSTVDRSVTVGLGGLEDYFSCEISCVAMTTQGVLPQLRRNCKTADLYRPKYVGRYFIYRPICTRHEFPPVI